MIWRRHPYQTISVRKELAEFLDWLRRDVFVLSKRKRDEFIENKSSWTVMLTKLIEFAIIGLRAEGYSELADIIEHRFQKLLEKNKYIWRGYGFIDVSLKYLPESRKEIKLLAIKKK